MDRKRQNGAPQDVPEAKKIAARDEFQGGAETTPEEMKEYLDDLFLANVFGKG